MHIHPIEGGWRNGSERCAGIETLVGDQRLNAGAVQVLSSEQAVVLKATGAGATAAIELTELLGERQLLKRIGGERIQRVRVVKAIVLFERCVEGIVLLVAVEERIGLLAAVVVEEAARNAEIVSPKWR